jgi:spermidine/putrescine transport system ATP-binding protein
MSQPADLVLDEVVKRYGASTAVAGVSLAAPTGSYVVLLGPSGSGKTTLLAMIGGFTFPSSGSIRIGSVDVTQSPPAKRPTATVFQDYALFPHLGVAENVGFGLSVRGDPRPAIAERVEATLGLVGLRDYGARRIDQLSGGQRQRVALARALAVEPSVLLLDEPLGALDLNLRRQVQEELKRLQRETGRTFVQVTHDQEEAMALADILVVLNAGRIEDVGPPERVYARPASRFTAAFMGESNLVEGRVRDDGRSLDTGFGVLPAPEPQAPGTAMALALRPETIRPAGEGMLPLGRARIAERVFQGATLRLRLAFDGGRSLLARIEPGSVPAGAEAIDVGVRAEDLVPLTR